MYYTNKEDMSESATGYTSPSEYTASLTEAKLLAECEVALDESRNWDWMVTCWNGKAVTVGIIDNYGTIINLPRYAYLQHFTYTHD